MGKNRKRNGGQTSPGENTRPFDNRTIDEINNDAINKALAEENFENIELEALEYEANQGKFIITNTDSSSDDETYKLVNPRKDYQQVTVDRGSNRMLLINRESGNSGLGDILSKIDEHVGQNTRNINIVYDPFLEQNDEGFIIRNGTDLVINSAYVDGSSTSEINDLLDDYFNNYG